MVKTKKPADTSKSSDIKKKSKASSSKTTKSSSTTTTKENIKPKNDDDDDFVKEKKVKASSSTEPKKKKLLKKKKLQDNDDIESDPETNDIEKNVEETNYVLGKEILTLKTSSEVLNFANDLFEKTFTKPEIEETDTKKTNVITEDDKLLSLFSIFKNCVGCKFFESLNANSFFTELYQKFEEIIESGLLNKATAKKIGLDLFDLLDNNCGHYNNDKKFRDLNIDEDFDSICKRLMSAGN
jgi:hypothetical protein